jgi:hypothetical protein
MSFKLKRWATLRTVNMQEFIPGIKSYKTPGGAGITTKAYSFPWQGKVIVCGYSADDESIWTVYDPQTHTISGVNTFSLAWNTYSAFQGWQTTYKWWGNRWLMGCGLSAGYYFSTGTFFGWDESFNLVNSKPPTPWHEYDILWPCSGIGSANGVDPTRLYYGVDQNGPAESALIRATMGGAGPTIVHLGSLYWDTTWGSTHFESREFGQYFGWKHDDGYALYTSPPHDSDDPYICLGSFGSWTGNGPAASGFMLKPDGSGIIMKCNVPSLGGEYWADITQPLISIEKPWQSNWHYRQQLDGGYRLDEYDLDGLDHGVAVGNPGNEPICFNSDLGWYVSVSTQETINPTILVLDPYQPASRPAVRRDRHSPPAGWAGEYAIRDDLALEHVLPFPDERNPSGSGVKPPQIRKDGYIVGTKELFRQQGNKILYEKDIQIDISSYPWQDEDFWWPGADGDHVPGMMELFAGGDPTIVGRMPDYMWGMLNPLGKDIAYGLGFATESFEGGDTTHTLKNAYRINPTSFATPITGALSNQRRFLSGVGDDRYAYCESGTRLMAMPAWRAVVGRVNGASWTTLMDFEDVGLPGLGETNWTVWSVVSIPACSSLKKGGWLVGATLYFDPWEENDWEQTPGAREATFIYKSGVDSGQGWVPARPGYVGPLMIDHHQPVLLTAYDEWTAGRSLYGPDALLVYDNDGEFVDCLNSPDIYPPNGKEIMVVPGGIPRVIYRVYRYGTYSDCAEGWGQYHGSSTSDIEVQAPMYVCYDLENHGRIQPGAGTFRGFVDMYQLRDFSTQGAAWRWQSCCPSIYDWQYPKSQWAPPGSSYVRAGLGGRSITILSPGPGQGRSAVKGVGRRA